MGLIKLNGVNYWGSNYGAGIVAPMIYSDEEREVGVWRDNKPLYQKTAYISNVSILANSSTNVNISDYFSDVDSAVDYECCDENGNSIFPNIMVNNGLSPYSIGVTVDKSSDHIVFTRGNGSNATISVRFTLRYTKTTDVAGSGKLTPTAMPTVHYSTEEQVIGTWMGQTLYEKSYHVTAPSTANVSTNIIDTTDLNINYLAELIGSIKTSANTTHTGGNSFVLWARHSNADGNKIACNVSNTSYLGGDMYVTLRYTKSS